MKKISIALVIMMLLTTAFGVTSFADADTALIDEFIIYKAATINSMDFTVNTAAASFEVYGYVGEGLYKWESDGSKLILGLADSEEISEDGLTRTYHIREDAKYSNGTPITAHDFEYSWKRLVDPATAAEYANMTTFAGIKNAEAIMKGEKPVDELGVEATDDHTLVVTLDTPVNFFPSLMTFATFFPLNQEFVESCGDQFGLSVETTLCSGPYELVEWTTGGTKETVQRNPYYYDIDKLKVDKLSWQIISEVSSGIMGYEMGTLDVMRLTSEFVDQYKDNPGYNPLLASSIYWLQFNCREDRAFSNMNLRKAISYCIDRQGICDNILKNGSLPATYYVPKSFQALSGGGNFREYAAELGYGEDGQGNYQIEDDAKAAEYYNKYVEETGNETTEVTMIFTNTDTYNYIAAYVKQEIESVMPGLTWNIQPLESNDRIAKSKSGDFDVVMGGWGADYQDASNWVMMDTADSSFNYGKWVSIDGKFDELDVQYRTVDAADEYKRTEDMIKMEEILLTEAGKVPLYQTVDAYLINPEYTVPLTATGGWLYQYTTANEG